MPVISNSCRVLSFSKSVFVAALCLLSAPYIFYASCCFAQNHKTGFWTEKKTGELENKSGSANKLKGMYITADKIKNASTKRVV